jgi:autotransporter-associated beta strand protein
MQKQINRLAVVIAVASFVAMGWGSAARAANVTWNLPGSGNWDTSTANWSDGVSSVNYIEGDNAQFNFNNVAGGTINVAGPGTGGSVSPSSTAFNNAVAGPTNNDTVAATFTVSGGPIASGNITKTGGGIVTLNSAYTGTGTLSASAGTLNVNGGGANATGFVSNGGTLNLGFSYSGTTPLTATPGTIGITNGATWTLNANATGNGTIFVGAGSMLKLTANEQLADTLNLGGGGGTFDMGGFNETIKNLNSGVNIINMGNLTVKSGFDHGSGNMSGSGALINDVGANFGLILNGSMTYTGGTYVKSGKFYLYGTANNILPSTGAVTVDSTGIFSLNYHNTNGRTQTIGALFGTGSIKSSNEDSADTIFQIGNGGGSGNFSGVFSGNGSLVKLGTGTQVLDGNNTYTGSTTVSGGKLIVNGITGAGQGNYSVASGATLGGSGTLNLAASKAVTILSGGILEPGNSAGTMTINGGLNLNDGAILNFELGSGGDTVVVNGLLTGSASSGGITLNLLPLSQFGSFVLLDWIGGSVSGLDLADFNVVGEASGNLLIVGSQLIFSSPVPEPASFALFGLGLLALAGKGRRRRDAQAA